MARVTDPCLPKRGRSRRAVTSVGDTRAQRGPWWSDSSWRRPGPVLPKLTCTRSPERTVDLQTRAQAALCPPRQLPGAELPERTAGSQGSEALSDSPGRLQKVLAPGSAPSGSHLELRGVVGHLRLSPLRRVSWGTAAGNQGPAPCALRPGRLASNTREQN